MPNARSFKRFLTVFLVLLLAVCMLVLFKGYLDGHFRSMESLRAYVGSFGLFAPLVLTVIQAIQVVLPVLPGFLGCIVGAGMFGAMGGFWCNYIGISAGSIIAFLLARTFGTSLVQCMVPMEKYHSFVEWIERRRSYTVILFLAILLPLAPDDFLCYFSGLTGMSTKKFTWIILLGKPWCILGYSLFFAYFAK
ncbi:TVP38/TMEM64 family protein [Lawsonibacter sp. LCP25S3_G6]|uniref:TVP38/TMEM64 family protein n=1 Tax=unclassified Lawsonibacter TaxID=2617946 RepID=UPI003F9B76B4